MGSHPEPDLTALIGALARQLRHDGLPFMLIGGQAVLLHGRPRLTEDIDLTLGAGPEALPAIRGVCRTLGLTPLPDDVDGFVRQTFVLPALHEKTRIRIDFVFSTTAYERQAIERADRVEVGGEEVPFAAAEDLILHKLFAGRAIDWEDAVSVARRRRAELDWDYIQGWAREFAAVPGREDLPDQVERLRGEAFP